MDNRRKATFHKYDGCLLTVYDNGAFRNKFPEQLQNYVITYLDNNSDHTLFVIQTVIECYKNDNFKPRFRSKGDPFRFIINDNVLSISFNLMDCIRIEKL